MSQIMAQEDPIVPSNSLFHGFYVGGHIGSSYFSASTHDENGYITLSAPATYNLASIAFAGGFQIGYDCLYDSIVVGGRLDWSWTNPNFNQANSPLLRFSARFDERVRFLSTACLRAGLTWEKTLFYISGGAAAARWHFKTELQSTENLFNLRRTRWGWCVGIGTEFYVYKCVTINAEILFCRLNHFRSKLLFSPISIRQFRFSFFDDLWIARIGLNYRFCL